MLEAILRHLITPEILAKAIHDGGEHTDPLIITEIKTIEVLTRSVWITAVVVDDDCPNISVYLQVNDEGALVAGW
jgi:hypothetical protein